MGIDIQSEPGQVVNAAHDGRAIAIKGKYSGVQISNKSYMSRTLYVEPTKELMNAGSKGLWVNAGNKIGTALDITSKYPGITNHIHFQFRIHGDNWLNPTGLMYHLAQ